MSKLFKIVALVLLLVMTIVMVSACSGISKIDGDGDTNKSAEVQGDNAGTKLAKESIATETPKEEPLEEVTLKFWFPDTKKSATDDVWNAISEKTKDKLNAKFEINYAAWGDYQSKISLLAASGDNYDLNFDASWLMYNQLANKGAYLGLNDLLPKYAPKLYEKYKNLNYIPSMTYNGEIICLPWTLSKNGRPFLIYRADIVKKLNLTVPEKGTIEDVDRLLQAVQKANLGITTFGFDNFEGGFILQMLCPKYEYCTWNNHMLTFSLNDDNCKVIPFEQTEAFKEAVQYAKKWTEEGIMPKNLMVDNTKMQQNFDAGKLFAMHGNYEMAYINEAFTDESYEKGAMELYADKKYVNDSPRGNLVCINKNAANPERTLMFLELMSNDQEIYDMVIYGIEGATYMLDGDIAQVPAGMDPNNSNYFGWSGQWGFWRAEFMRPDTTYPKDFWKGMTKYASENPANISHKIADMSIDTTNIKNEIAKRDSLYNDMGKLLIYGNVKDIDKSLAEYIEKQKAAGLDKILEEYQKQVDAALAK
ncbi:MAG: extracellular solute-binding protein [Bacillota bacterium]